MSREENFKIFMSDLENQIRLGTAITQGMSYVSDLHDFYYYFNDCPSKDYFTKFVLVADQSVREYDSYGNEDSTIKKVYRLPEYGDILIKLVGTHRSHAGEELGGFFLTKEITKTYTTYE